MRAWTPLVWSLLLGVSPARAEESLCFRCTPAEAHNALPGVEQVGLPTPVRSLVSVAGGVGLGYVDSAGASDEALRTVGNLAVAVAPVSFWALGLTFAGRWDEFPSAGQTKLSGEPRIETRFMSPAFGRFRFGLHGGVRLVGAAFPSIAWEAASPWAVALGSWHPTDRLTIGLQFGFHGDRSAAAWPGLENFPTGLTANNKVTLGASFSPSVRWGLAATYRLPTISTELLAELSADTLVGDRAPTFSASPWRLYAGARHPLSQVLTGTVGLTLGLSSRLTKTEMEQNLLPIEPRILFSLGASWAPGARPMPSAPVRKAISPPPKAVDKKPEAPAPPTDQQVHAVIVDEGGRPLPDVEVVIELASGQRLEARTFADGSFAVEHVPLGEAYVIRLLTPGYEKATLPLEAGQAPPGEIVLYPALPVGMVRGAVLDMRGRPLDAIVEIQPLGRKVALRPDGTFEVELEPGRYSFVFSKDGFARQERAILVEKGGVFILNIALSH